MPIYINEVGSDSEEGMMLREPYISLYISPLLKIELFKKILKRRQIIIPNNGVI